MQRWLCSLVGCLGSGCWRLRIRGHCLDAAFYQTVFLKRVGRYFDAYQLTSLNKANIFVSDLHFSQQPAAITHIHIGRFDETLHAPDRQGLKAAQCLR